MSFKKTYNQKKEEFEEKLKEVFYSIKGIPELLQRAMEYSLVEMGGKRIRPILFLESYKMFSSNTSVPSFVYDFAIAIECVHSYSLIHDDLPSLDNDDFRKGRPSSHKVFGEGVAILAGDALLNLAYELIFDAIKKSSLNADFVSAAAYFSKCMGARGMIAGQIIDIKAAGKKLKESEAAVNEAAAFEAAAKDGPNSLTNEVTGEATIKEAPHNLTGDIIKYIYRHKTGDLIIASCLSGAVIGGASVEEKQAMIDFADYFSYAFQIKDDILDYDKKDKESTEISFVRMYGMTRTTQTLGDSTQRAQKALDRLKNRDVSFFRDIALLSAARKK